MSNGNKSHILFVQITSFLLKVSTGLISCCTMYIPTSEKHLLLWCPYAKNEISN